MRKQAFGYNTKKQTWKNEKLVRFLRVSWEIFSFLIFCAIVSAYALRLNEKHKTHVEICQQMKKLTAELANANNELMETIETVKNSKAFRLQEISRIQVQLCYEQVEGVEILRECPLSKIDKAIVRFNLCTMIDPESQEYSHEVCFDRFESK